MSCLTRTLGVVGAIAVIGGWSACGRMGFELYTNDSDRISEHSELDSITGMENDSSWDSVSDSPVGGDSVSDTAETDSDDTQDTLMPTESESGTTDSSVDTESDSATDTATDTDTAPDSDTDMPASCYDGVKDSFEFFTDCGGLYCPPCPACTVPFDPPEEIVMQGVTGDVFAPFLSWNNQTLYFEATDTDNEDIYSVERSGRGIDFGVAAPAKELNSVYSDGTPCCSSDKTQMVFYSTRPGSMGGRDLWLASRDNSSVAFAEIVPLTEINSTAIDHMPSLSVDMLTLYYTSFRSDGVGMSDIWMARRANPKSPFAAPQNPSELNTVNREESPWVAADGLVMYFISDRTGGMGGADIWWATRPDSQSPFSAPVNLSDLNSAADEVDVSLSADEQEIYFSSNRNGPYTLWRAWRTCAQ